MMTKITKSLGKGHSALGWQRCGKIRPSLRPSRCQSSATAGCGSPSGWLKAAWLTLFIISNFLRLTFALPADPPSTLSASEPTHHFRGLAQQSGTDRGNVKFRSARINLPTRFPRLIKRHLFLIPSGLSHFLIPWLSTDKYRRQIKNSLCINAEAAQDRADTGAGTAKAAPLFPIPGILQPKFHSSNSSIVMHLTEGEPAGSLAKWQQC